MGVSIKQKQQPHMLYFVVLATCCTTWLAWQYKDLEGLLIYRSDVVTNTNEWYRFITSGFLHADGRHLFKNMVFLGFFGFMILRQGTMGQVPLLGLYMTGLVVSSYISHWLRTDSRNVIFIEYGASGGVFAVMGASLLLTVPSRRMAWVLIILISWLEYRSIGSNDGVGHVAHLAGIMYGIALACLFYPRMLFGSGDKDYEYQAT